MNLYPSMSRPPVGPMGATPNVLAHDYHSWAAVSSSLLKAAAGGLSAAHHYLHDTEPKGWSTWFGSYIHARLLEPDTIASQGTIKGLSPKAQGATFLKASIEHGTPVPIAEGWREMGDKIEDAIAENVLAEDLLASGKAELSLLWNDLTASLTECVCKARLDLWDRQNLRIVDIKTADKVDEYSFERAAKDFGYHIQAAHYLRGARKTLAADTQRDIEFWFIAIQNKPPFDVEVYRARRETFLDPGETLRSELLDAVVMADATGEWRHPQSEPHDLSLPRWAISRFADGEAV